MRYNICGPTRKFRLQFKIFLLIGILLRYSVVTWAEAPEVFLYYGKGEIRAPAIAADGY